MTILAIANNKGGVGKTTTAQNLAAALAEKGYPVLAIDLDAQGSLTRSCGLTQVRHTSGDFLQEEAALANCKVRVGEDPFAYDLLPGGEALNKHEDAVRNSPEFPHNLKLALQPLAAQYAFVVLDCPPALSGFTRLALVASDFYFVPLQAEYLSYKGLRSFLTYTERIQAISGAKLGGVFATRYNPRMNVRLSQDLISSTQQQLGAAFIDVYIRNNIALSEAQAYGQSIFAYDSQSNGAKDYRALTEAILIRTGHAESV